MKTITEIIQYLYAISEARPPVKIELIKKLQNEIWEDEYIQDEELNEILSGLAYDLDFYEPNDDRRKESLSYYDDNKLEEKIKYAIQKLKKYS